MDKYEFPDEQSVEGLQEYTKADLIKRVIARIIDFIIVVTLYEIIPRVGFLAGATYIFIADGLFQGRSPGKRLVGLKVISLGSSGNYAPCGFKESIYRNVPFAAAFILFGILSVIPVIGWLLSFVVVVVIVLFEVLILLGSEQGMRLGDELAKTRVVEDRQGEVNV